MKNRIMRCQLGFLLLGFLLAVLAAASFRVGSVSLSLQDIQAILSGTDRESTAYHILWDIRLPRLLAAALLGGALSVSGFLLQTFFANPIAGPFVLGISSGAKLVVALVMILFLGKGLFMGSATMIVAAFAGSMLSMGFVLVIAKRIRQMSVLVVCGVMISYICSAVTDFVVTFADDANIVNLHNWSMGSFSGTTWDQVRVITVVVLPVFVLAFCMAKPISAYRRRICQKPWCKCKAFPCGTDFIIQCVVRLRDGLCRSGIFCGNRSAAARETAVWDGEADRCDPRLLPGRCGVLPVQ